MADTETYTVVAPNDDEDDVELPAGLVDMLTEAGENRSRVLTDVVAQAMAQQAHMLANHTETETPDDIDEINDTAEQLFEDRFGTSLADALGHDH